MKILIYYPGSYISVFILTAIEDLLRQQHTVYLLTTAPSGMLHQAAEELGAKVFTSPGSNEMRRIVKDVRRLISFCREHKIDFVFSHLQYLNLVASVSRFFIRAAVFPMRHHADDVYLSGNRNARLLDRLVNVFSKKILVVSSAAKTQMLVHEHVPVSKITVLPLYYNFNFYSLPDASGEHNGSDQISTGLRLINIGRMVENKNHMTLLEVMRRLTGEGMDIKLTLLGSGPLEDKLKYFVNQAGLTDNILFLGSKTDVLRYISAADIMVHTSVSEASCQVTKEAGICRVPVITVKGVGDFDEYITDQKNGFVLPGMDMEDELYKILKSVYQNRSVLKGMGKELEESVREKFDVASVKKTYVNIVNGILE